MFAIVTTIKNKNLYLKKNNTDLRFTDKIDESYKFDSKQVKRLLKKLKIDQPHLKFKKYRIPKKYCLNVINVGNFTLRKKIPYSEDLMRSIEKSNLDPNNFFSDYGSDIKNYILLSNTETFRTLLIGSIKQNYHNLCSQFYNSFDNCDLRYLKNWRVSIIYIDSSQDLKTLNLYTLKNEPILRREMSNNLSYRLDFQVNKVELNEINNMLKNKFKSRLVKKTKYDSTDSIYIMSERNSVLKTYYLLKNEISIFYNKNLDFLTEPMFLKFMFFELAYLVTHLIKEGLKFEIKFEEI